MLGRTTSTNLPRQYACDKNPKSEYRNPKQTLKQMNLKSGKSKTSSPKEACLEFDSFWYFEFVSIRGAAFGFRASDFCFWRPFHLCARITIQRRTTWHQTAQPLSE
jgi:hypothetical protein